MKKLNLIVFILLFSFTWSVFAGNHMISESNLQHYSEVMETTEVTNASSVMAFEVTWTADLSCRITVSITADVESVERMVDVTMAVDYLVCNLGLIAVK